MDIPKSAIWPLQIAVVDRLANDAQLAQLLGQGDAARIYDTPAPPNTALPYLTITNKTESGAHTFGRWGNADSLQVHALTDVKKFRSSQGMAIYGHCKRLFQGQQFTVAGHTLMAAWVEMLIEFIEPSGDIHHTVITISARIQQGTD